MPEEKDIPSTIHPADNPAMTPLPSREGYASFRDYKVWYRIVGDHEEAGKLPLLVLHGGPGAAHDYLEPIEALAATGRCVIFYDQLGCGRSAQPHNPDMWTVDLFVEELGVMRQALGLDHTHILGQSWGGMLAMQYALTQPQGVASLVIANSPASIPQWVAEANRLRADLPPAVQQILLHHEAANTTDDPAYQDAVKVFYARHLCRVIPFPDCVARSFAQMDRNPEVYHTMNGPSEFHCIGKIKDWDIIDRLHEITIPALVLSGRYDEATPLIAETVHKGISGSEWILFEESSHMPHVEETEHYMKVVEGFLRRIEAND